MPTQSYNFAAQTDAHRQRYGEDCQFVRYVHTTTVTVVNGITQTNYTDSFTSVGVYRALCKQVSANLTGTGHLPGGSALGPKFADAESWSFNFSPFAFAPYTTDIAPQTGDRIVRGGFIYEVSHVTPYAVAGDTVAWMAYGYKVLP